MGYKTFHNLKVHNDKSEEIIAELKKENEDANYALSDNGYGENWTKWYECDDEMKAFSLKYPSVLFEMHTEGEENGNLCTTYYKDGKMQECPAIITYDEFDQTKLK